jgi:two-component system response regulator DegU
MLEDCPVQSSEILTARELEVLRLVAQGLTNAQVGDTLVISPRTVEKHLASIYQKLDSRDRTQAVLRAVRMGIIRLD